MPGPRRLFLALAAMAVSSCGGEGGGAGGVDIRFSLERDGMTLACGDVSDVTEVEVTIFGASGATALPGFPTTANCATGTFRADLVDGSYVLQIIAYGKVGADARAVLFRSRTPFELPRDSSLDVSLAQDVASLKLSWVFLDKMLRPCADEDINRVGVTIAVVGAGTSDPFNVSYRCDETPVQVDRYFGLRNPNYTILVQAFSRENFPVYSVREVAVLERGSNEFTAVLQPDGGQLILQWQFEVPGSAPTTDCSDPTVGVNNVTIRISSPLGDEPISESAPCSQDNPYAFTARRFTQGQPLDIVVGADGVHRFLHIESFLMPEGDRDFGLLTLAASGTATAAWSVTSSSACAGQTGVSFELEIKPTGTTDVTFAETYPPMTASAQVGPVRYGTYDVVINGTQNDNILCTASGQRVIDRLDNRWEPFEL